MTISMDDIEKSTADYILQNRARPRYLLMDTESFKKLISAFTVKEKETLKVMDETEKNSIFKIHCTECKIDILSVESDKEMYELVR